MNKKNAFYTDMKENELMIGDWVKFPTSDLYHKVYAIQGKSVKIDKQYWHKADKLEPIPLTEKMLEKNGFCVFGEQATYGEESDYYGKPTAIRVQCNKYGDLHIWREYVYTEGREQHVVEYEPKLHLRTRYVHELQHALRLCGIEKEIVL